MILEEIAIIVRSNLPNLEEDKRIQDYEGKPQPAREVAQLIAREEKPVSEELYVEPNVSDLQTLFDIARKIYGSTERNAEYIRLVDLALSESKPGFISA